MPVDRSTRTLLSVILFVAAALLAVEYAATAVPLLGWWLPLLLFILGLALALMSRQMEMQPPQPSPSMTMQMQEFTHQPPPVIESAAPAAPAVAPVAEAAVEATPAVEPVAEVEAAPVEPVVEVAPAKPASESAVETAPVVPDDLTVVLGIGPKINKVLADAGVRTFGELAQTTPDQLREILSSAGLRLAPTLDTWAEQAALLAQGDRAGHEAWLERHAEERKAEN